MAASPIAAAFAAALERARAAKLVAYLNLDGSYGVPSVSHPGTEHTCRQTGPAWHEWSCDCPGANHVACMHRAVSIYAKKYGVHAVRPVRPSVVAQAEAVAAAADVAPSTPEEIAHTERIKAETTAALIAQVPVRLSIPSALDELFA